MGGTEPFLRTEVALAVFSERGLASLDQEGEALRISLHPEKKVVLEDSLPIRRLHKILGNEQKGGA